jgi:hypothetical protein
MRSVHSAVLALALAGLASSPASATDRGLGLVIQNNIAAMLVDPNPSYAGVKLEGTSGITADGALSRYRAGQVKPLIPLSGKSDLGTQFATGQASQTRGSDGIGAQRTGAN